MIIILIIGKKTGPFGAVRAAGRAGAGRGAPSVFLCVSLFSFVFLVYFFRSGVFLCFPLFSVVSLCCLL